MVLILTDSKKETLNDHCSEPLNKTTQTNRYVVKVIGLMT